MSVKKRLSQKMNRRRFLQRLPALGAGLLAACAAREPAGAPTIFRTEMPERVLDMQRVLNTGSQAAADASITLDQFLEISRLLTGVDNLDPGLGQVYLQALQSGADSASLLAGVYSAASSGSSTLPNDVQALYESGFFEQQGMSDLAVQITVMWYSGVYQQDGEDQVATTVDAMAWRVLNFTKPITICGAFGFWATDPNVEISPDIQYTPVPPPGQ